MAEPTVFDVVVIGAGPSGASVAYHLAQCGRQVLLIDKYAFPRDKACGDGLTPETVELLAEMGIQQELQAYKKVLGVRLITSTKGQRDAAYPPSNSPRPDYGFVIPRVKLDHMICQRAVKAGAVFWEKSTVTSPIWNGEQVCGVRVRKNNAELEVRARFVIAADGGNSHFARRIGMIHNDPWSRGYAVRGYYSGLHDLTDLFHVYVPLLDSKLGRMMAGYGWVFPMDAGLANIGVGFFPSRQQDFDTNLRSIFHHFLENLQQQNPRFAKIELQGQIRGAPLSSGLDPKRTSGKGVILVGDAAGLVDPFTGEGIYAGLRSGKLAAEVLEHSLSRNGNGSGDLREYSRLLEENFWDLFRLHRQFIKSYGFMWKLLDSTMDIHRPFFASFRRAAIDYGSSVDPYIGLALPPEMAGMEKLGVLADLKSIRDQLIREIPSNYPLLSKLTFNMLDLPGSLLRSVVLLLAGQFGPFRDPARIGLAASVELAHLASQIQDDVLDSNSGSSSGDSINWANMFTITASDFLMMRAYGITAGIGSEVSRLVSRASGRVAIGKMKADQYAHSFHLDEAGYLEIAADSTATFYELAALLGVKTAGGTSDLVHALSEYGHNLGLAYQLTKDTLDILGAVKTCPEHPLPRIFEAGHYTLPLIFSLSSPTETSLRALLECLPEDPGAARAALLILVQNGSLPYTLRQARRCADAAKASLSPLPDTSARQALTRLADYLLARVPPKIH